MAQLSRPKQRILNGFTGGGGGGGGGAQKKALQNSKFKKEMKHCDDY